MKPRHIDKVVDHFDEDRSGTIDKWEFLVGLRPERRVQFAREARTDTERIDHAVSKPYNCVDNFLIHLRLS